MSEEEISKKQCANCGADLEGTYCHLCGQKHIEHKHSFWQLMIHFIGDFVHFDAQLFSTLKPLFLKPGLVPKDYVEGKRKRHLEPIRMYVFVSIVFFFLFFNFSDVKTLDQSSSTIISVPSSNQETEIVDNDSAKLEGISTQLKDILPEEEWRSIDSDIKSGNFQSLEDLALVLNELELDSVKMLEIQEINNLYTQLPKGDNANNESIDLNIISYKSIEQYERHQDSLPKAERDGWVKNILNKKLINLQSRAKEEGQSVFMVILYQFLKSLPKILFILLPILGLVMKLLYIRRNTYYVDHMVFMIYYFCFVYIIQSINFILDISLGIWLPGIFILWAIIYYLFAMKRFYEQPWPKTILKYIIFINVTFILALFSAILGFLIVALFGS